MTHARRIDNMLATAAKQQNPWLRDHCAAWRKPRPVEQGIVGLTKAMAVYADSHKGRYGSGIGDDGVLGPSWGEILRHARALLNGECGRLHCGTVDSLLVAMLKAEGFDE